MTEKVAVIGSNSFSGSHFVAQALALGMKVIGISRSEEPDPVFLPYKQNQAITDNFTFFQFDLNHHLDKIMEVIFDFEPEYIVNFAAQGMVAESWKNPDHWLMANTLSAVKLHQRLTGCHFLKKFVQVSTPEVYGSCEGKVKENTIYNPSTPYAVSKAAADMSLMTFSRQYKFPVIFTRSANVYGPGQQLYRIVPKAMLFFLKKKKLELHGGGRSVRAFIDITDVIDGTIKAMRVGKPGEIYHFSSQDLISIRELVKMIAAFFDVSFAESIIDVKDRPGKDKAYILDSSKAINELGWQIQTSLNKGLQKTADWIKGNIGVLENQPYEYIHKP